MELKKEFIKSTIEYINNFSKCYFITTIDEIDVIKLLLNILSKEMESSKKIFLLSDNQKHLNNVFKNIPDGVKLNTPYAVKQHKLSFNILDKKLIKNGPLDGEVLIVYPYQNIKPKELAKYVDKCTNLQKLIILGHKFDKAKLPYEISILNILDFSFLPSHTSLYYNYMTSRLSDMK
ncbi:MAG: hypothetical protein ACRCVJ_07750 [Clostridium sp.]|uniref:hypothetical protein n=1 Tax=Clostridium sp. TaxID=1506 RepID=UPI003F3DDA12